MKLSDNPPKESDEVITEVRTIKRSISLRHDDDIDRLLASLMSREQAAETGDGEQGGAGQAAARPELE